MSLTATEVQNPNRAARRASARGRKVMYQDPKHIAERQRQAAARQLKTAALNRNLKLSPNTNATLPPKADTGTTGNGLESNYESNGRPRIATDVPDGEYSHPGGVARADKPPASFDSREQGQSAADIYATGFTKRDNKLVQDLGALYATTALYVGFVDQYLAIVIAEKATDAAIGWVAVAKRSKQLYKILEFVAQSNGYVLLASSHGAIAYAIAVRFNLLPKRFSGIGGGLFAGQQPTNQSTHNEYGAAVPATPQYAENASSAVAAELATRLSAGQSANTPAGPFGPTPENTPGVPGASTYELAPTVLTPSTSTPRPSMEQVMQFIAEQTRMQQQANSVVSPPTAGYNPNARIPGPEQDPAILGRIVPRRE